MVKRTGYQAPSAATPGSLARRGDDTKCTSGLRTSASVLNVCSYIGSGAWSTVNNYPPGVTGNEYEIAGPDYEKESDIPCSVCGKPTMELGYGDERWLTCVEYDHITNLEPLEDDPDRAYDEERDRQMMEEQDV